MSELRHYAWTVTKTCISVWLGGKRLTDIERSIPDLQDQPHASRSGGKARSRADFRRRVIELLDGANKDRKSG